MSPSPTENVKSYMISTLRYRQVHRWQLSAPQAQANQRSLIYYHSCLMREHKTHNFINHRSTVKNIDHIVVLDEGMNVEERTHETLQRLGGLYAEMYRRQLLGEELEDEEHDDLFSGR